MEPFINLEEKIDKIVGRRMKVVTHRAKDTGDLMFLRHWFESEGLTPPPG